MRILLPFKWQQLQSGKPAVLLLALLVPLLFLVFFLIGFFVSFPEAGLRDRIVAEINQQLPTGNRFDAKTVSLGFPLYLQVDQARLIMDSSPIPELILSTVRLSPTLSTLFGDPGVSISVKSDLGALAGIVSRSGEVDLHLRDGRFNQPLPGMENIVLSGVISSVDVVGAMQGGEDQPLRIEAAIDELLLTGGEQLGLGQNELPFGQLSLDLAGSGRSLQIDQLSLSGGVLKVSGVGKIIVQQPFSASRLDLKLNLRPDASADSGLLTLLELLGPVEKDGSHLLQLRGRLLAPQLK